MIRSLHSALEIFKFGAQSTRSAGITRFSRFASFRRKYLILATFVGFLCILRRKKCGICGSLIS